MTDEIRRRQKRAALMEKAKQIQEADRQRRLGIVNAIIEARRSLKGPISPERLSAEFRSLFVDNRCNAKIDTE